MTSRKTGEEVEECSPDENKEEEHEEEDGVGRDVLGGKEVEPIPAVGCGEEVVLDGDDDEKPEDDFAAED